ncbi:MAG: LytTR family DNA-binding domain-containing protein [Pseudomonadota bacterium]
MAVWVLSSAIAAYMGPFGTFLLLDLGDRVLLWTAIVGWGLFAIAVTMTVEETFLPWLSFRQRELGRLLVSAPLIIAVLWPGVGAYFRPDPVPITFVQAMVACYLVGAIVTLARMVMHAAFRTAEAADAPEPAARVPEEDPRLLRRLPKGTPGPILRLSGKGHYVEIVTPSKAHTVRMRLADAVEEMDGVEGYLTHRSHWVARRAVTGATRHGGKHYLISADAELIPVSKGKLPQLEEAGLLRS